MANSGKRVGCGAVLFGGASSDRLQHTGIIIIYAVFPLALLLLQLALQRRSLLLAAGFAIIAADVGLGRNQVALLVCALLLAAAVAEILVSAQPLSYLRERSGVLATSSPAVAKDRQAASVPGARATNGVPSRRLQHRPDMAAASGRTSGHSDASVAGEQSPVRQRQCRELGKPTWRCLNRLSLSSAWLAPLNRGVGNVRLATHGRSIQMGHLYRFHDVVVKCALPPRTDIVSRLTTSEKWLKAASNVSKTRTVLTSLKLAN
jgi:hypothetical protein